MQAARTTFRSVHADIARKYMFAGDEKTQLYIQMHSSHHAPLTSGAKTVTRRAWNTTWIRAHTKALHAKQLVAVIGQSHASTIGYIRYTEISISNAGAPLSPLDLQKEGYTGWTDAMFRRKWYRIRGTTEPLPDQTPIYILSFEFFPLHTQ